MADDNRCTFFGILNFQTFARRCSSATQKLIPSSGCSMQRKLLVPRPIFVFFFFYCPIDGAQSECSGLNVLSALLWIVRFQVAVARYRLAVAETDTGSGGKPVNAMEEQKFIAQEEKTNCEATNQPNYIPEI